MLKCASIFTYEIDDPHTAFTEIKTQLDQKIQLLEHSAGIIMCHPEFIASGVVRHICEKLPFDVAGVTTAAQAVNGEAGELILTIFVMTSDDVWFKTGITGGLEEDIDGAVKSAVDGAASGACAPPAIALIFPPLIFKRSGDSYVEAMRKAIPNVPVFGPIAIDDTLTYELSETIYNGENHRTAMPFILCYGNINPRFIVGTFPKDKAMPYTGEITKSSGSLVSEINNINAYNYFESIGFVNNGVLAENLTFVPFALSQKKRSDYDGIPVIRGIAFFNEDGTAVFRGDADEGSTFTMLASDSEDVLSATRKTIEQINDLPGVNGAVLFSCIGRRMMTMHNNHLSEAETVTDTIRSGIPFILGYAGGEISPTLVRDAIPTNRFHNYSLVVLVV
ncbi:MAG: FIST C-terminal domain-containing protein [Treponema sp.]|nr:FIST C-terminal domain-containing protein [Treponema sp.]